MARVRAVARRARGVPGDIPTPLKKLMFLTPSVGATVRHGPGLWHWPAQLTKAIFDGGGLLLPPFRGNRREAVHIAVDARY